MAPQADQPGSAPRSPPTHGAEQWVHLGPLPMPTNASFPDGPRGPFRFRDRLEAGFERFLWQLRLIAILPVIMSLASTGVTFVLGTLEIGKAILGLSHAADAVEKGYMAKLLGARVAWAAADNGLQIHGGNGFALEYKISRILCDARILNIFEGAAEIQAQVIARRLLD